MGYPDPVPGNNGGRVLGFSDSTKASMLGLSKKNDPKMVPENGLEGKASANDKKVERRDSKIAWFRAAGTKIDEADAIPSSDDGTADTLADTSLYGVPEVNIPEFLVNLVGSNGLPLYRGVDFCRTETQRSVFELISIEMGEMDSDRAVPVAESSGKVTIHMEIPEEGRLESIVDPERIDVGSEQYLGPNFGRGSEEDRGNDMNGNKWDRVPVKSWKNLFSVPKKTNGMLYFSRP